MLQQLYLRDQTHGRPSAQVLVMDWQDGVPLTPRTLISERVRIEWEARETAREARAEACGTPAPLVDWIRRLNPYRSAKIAASSPPDAVEPVTLDAVTALALEGFVRNAFFLVVDGRQVTDLDLAIPLRPTSEVTFVRLLPLQSG